MNWKDDNACGFKGCLLIKGDGLYCPRHSALVKEFGLVKAEGIEIGYLCHKCNKRSEHELTECKNCGSTACHACQTSRLCCDQRATELETEAQELEDQADDLRADANDIRSARVTA